MNTTGEYDAITDPMTSDKPNRMSHITYAYATQVVILDAEGRVQKVVAAHDVGKAINPNGVEGQIEGGVVMGLGYALTEEFPLSKGVPTARLSTLGLIRSTQVPEIECIIIEKNPAELAYGAKGMGEIVSVATPPAVARAYFQRDGKLRNSLPLQETPYSADRAARKEVPAQKEEPQAEPEVFITTTGGECCVGSRSELSVRFRIRSPLCKSSSHYVSPSSSGGRLFQQVCIGDNSLLFRPAPETQSPPESWVACCPARNDSVARIALARPSAPDPSLVGPVDRS